jgi:hypothetical protein
MHLSILALYLSILTLATAQICTSSQVDLAGSCATSDIKNFGSKEAIPSISDSKPRMPNNQRVLIPDAGCELPSVMEARDVTPEQRPPCINVWDVGATLNVIVNGAYESLPGEAGGPPSEATIRKELKARGYEEEHIEETVARLHEEEIWG